MQMQIIFIHISFIWRWLADEIARFNFSKKNNIVFKRLVINVYFILYLNLRCVFFLRSSLNTVESAAFSLKGSAEAWIKMEAWSNLTFIRSQRGCIQLHKRSPLIGASKRAPENVDKWCWFSLRNWEIDPWKSVYTLPKWMWSHQFSFLFGRNINSVCSL